MIINYKNREIQIKIVYYGCALSGKTTSLRNLFKKFDKAGPLTSIETTSGRTLFFDFGTIKMRGGEWNIKISLFSATGQDFYASTRPATLSGADGIIFLIDSQKKYLKDNIISWRELNYYYNEEIVKIPIIYCLNKQDLPDVIEKDDILRAFELQNYSKIDFFITIATNGEGIIEPFKRALNFIFPSITIR